MCVCLQGVFSKSSARIFYRLILVLGLIVLNKSLVFSQCQNPSISLPDAAHPVDGNTANAYCTTVSFDPATTGLPTGLSMNLNHTWQGDLSIIVIVGTNVLNVMQRPGTNNCSGGCDCGDDSNVNGTYIFTDVGTDPDGGMAGGGGAYGVTSNDPCGVGTVTTFGELWAPFGPGEIITATICITDHALSDTGVASDVTFLYPNQAVCGCTDSNALNFNPSASVDDNSCIYDCPELHLTVAQDYLEFCVGDNFFVLSANSSPETTLLDQTIPSYEWSANNGGDDFIIDPSNANTEVIIPSDFEGSITFTVTVTYEVSEGDLYFICDDYTEVEVFVIPGPFVEIIGPDEGCPNDVVELETIGGPFTEITWVESGTTGPFLFAETGGTYHVMAEDLSGCIGTAEFTVDALPEVFPEIVGPYEICFELGEALLSVNENYDSYDWVTGESSDAILVSDAGQYDLTVVDFNGCSGVASFFIGIGDSLVVDIAGDNEICDGETSLLLATPGFDTYQWSTGVDGENVLVNSQGGYFVSVTDVNGCPGSAEFELVVNSNPEVEIFGPEELCNEVPAELSTLDGFITIGWNNGGTSIVNQIPGPGTYSVTVADENQCIGEDSITILEGFALPIEIIGPVEICANIEHELTTSGGFLSFVWSLNNTSTPTLNINEPGSYTVTAVDADGCIATDAIDIGLTPGLTPSLSGDLDICFGETTTLSTETGYFSYEWEGGISSNETLSVNTSGNYTVTVTEADGCVGTANVNVEVFTLPLPDIQGDLILCEDEVSTLSLIQNYVQYAWSTSSTDTTIDVIQGINYSVTVTDTNGCTGEDTVSLEEIDISVAINGDTDICVGESSQFAVPAEFSIYQWSGGETSPQITANSTGNTSVTVTDENGCIATDDIDLIVNDLPEVAIDGRLSYCPAGATQLTATEGYVSYQWSNAANTAVIEINEETTYGVTVTDENECQNSASVFVLEEDNFDIVVNGQDFCADLSTQLTVEGSYVSYNWSTNSDQASITVNQSNTYSVTVMDEFGCEGIDNVTVEALALPEPEISGELEYCIGESTVLASSGFVNYTWSVLGGNIEQVEVSSPVVVGLTVVDEEGCIGATSVEVIENPLPVHAIQGIPAFCPDESTILTAEEGFVIYNWNNNSSATSIAVDVVQVYELSVTDGNGCVGIASIDVSEYQTEIPQIVGEFEFCPEESTDLSIANSFDQYNWSTGSTALTINTSNIDSITILVTDTNGCVTENTTGLSYYQVIAPEINAVEGFCTGLTASLVATPGYMSYNWSNAETISAITIEGGGVYELDVIDQNGCASDAVVSIEEYDLPTPVIGGSLTFCTGLNTILNPGEEYAIYSWSTGDISSDIMINTPGPISLTVTDSNGCVGNTSEFVNEATELSPIISGELEYCAGLSTELSAGNGFVTYNWTNATGVTSIIVTEPGFYSLSVVDAGGCSGSTTVEVVENQLPEPQILGLLAYCEGLQTELSSSQAYETYSWSTGNPTSNIVVNTEGIYELTVTDIKDCENSALIEIIEQPAPIYEITGPDEFCINESTELTIEPAYTSYEWSVTGNGQSVIVSNSGIIAVTVTDEFGCQASQNIQLSTVNLPIADAGALQTIDCNFLEVALGGNSNPGDGYSYIWSGPGIETADIGQLLHPIVNEAGEYTLLVTNNEFGCLSEPANVTVNNEQFIPQIILEVIDVLNCVTDEVQIDARASATNPSYVYQWFDGSLNPISGATSLVYNASIPQFYSLQILDMITGCDNTEGIDVEENIGYPFAEAGEPQLLTCSATNVDLNGSVSQAGGQIAYSWTTEEGAFSSDPANNVVSVSSPGFYFLEVEDVVNGCANIDTVLVTQNIAHPTAVTSDEFELNCLEPSTILSGQGSSIGDIYSYQWLLNQSPVEGANQLQLEVETPGLYTFQVTNMENDCITPENVEISLNEASPKSLNYVTDKPTCAGDSDGIILLAGVEGGTPPFLYSINGAPFSNTLVYEDLNAGVYNIILEDVIGCLLTTEIEVIDGNDLWVDLGDDQYKEEGELADIYTETSVDSSQLVSINWQTTANLECKQCIVQLDLKLDQSTQFFLRVKDENGCVAEDNVTIFIDKKRPIFVPSAFSPDEDGDNDIFYIFAGDIDIKINSFVVFNRWGESVFEVYGSLPNDPRSGWDGKYRGQVVNTAVYVWFAEIEYTNGDVEIIKGDVVVMH